MGREFSDNGSSGLLYKCTHGWGENALEWRGESRDPGMQPPGGLGARGSCVRWARIQLHLNRIRLDL